MSAYIKNTERSQVNNLMSHLKLLEKHERAKPKTSKRREVIKTKAKINNRDQKSHTKKSMKQKPGSLKK
jgi:hypothetical protein